jgi:hypothetical protein
MIITVEADRLDDGRITGHITGHYHLGPQAVTAADALARFADAHPDAVAATPQQWLLTAHGPETGPQPERALLNWEQDPTAEVGEGWLSNMAISAANHDRELEWRPRYRTRAIRETPCPDCGTPLALRIGQWGAFYHCRCGWKTGAGTRKAGTAEAGTRITSWCGTRLVPRINLNGVPYAGCPSCDPDDQTPTMRQLTQ